MPFPSWRVMSVPRRLAQTWIPRMIQFGYSANRGLKALKEHMIGYRRTTFLSDWREWQKAITNSKAIRYTANDRKISLSRYIHAAWRKKGVIETIMRVDAVDPLTGQLGSKYVTITHTHLEHGMEVPDTEQVYTAGDLKDMALSRFTGYGEFTDWEVKSIVPEMGYFNPEM